MMNMIAEAEHQSQRELRDEDSPKLPKPAFDLDGLVSFQKQKGCTSGIIYGYSVTQDELQVLERIMMNQDFVVGKIQAGLDD